MLSLLMLLAVLTFLRICLTSDGWNIDVLHGHREVRVRRTIDGCGDVGAEGRLLEIVFCLLAGV